MPGRRLEVYDRASRSDVRVANDLVHRAHGGAGHSGGGETRLDVGEIVPPDPGRDELVGCSAVLQARGAGGESRVLRRVGGLDRLAETRKRLIARARERDEPS